MPTAPIKIDECTGLSQLSLGDAPASAMKPSELSLKLHGRPSRQSAFQANPSLNENSSLSSSSNVISVVWIARRSRCEDDDGMEFKMETLVVSIMYIWVSSAAQRLCAWLILQLFQEIFRLISSLLDEATICNWVLGFDIWWYKSPQELKAKKVVFYNYKDP